jgi:hypothetical protein
MTLEELVAFDRGEITLQQARDAWETLRVWAREAGY